MKTVRAHLVFCILFPSLLCCSNQKIETGQTLKNVVRPPELHTNQPFNLLTFQQAFRCQVPGPPN